MSYRGIELPCLFPYGAPPGAEYVVPHWGGQTDEDPLAQAVSTSRATLPREVFLGSMLPLVPQASGPREYPIAPIGSTP